MTNFAFRIHRPYKELEELLENMKESCDKLIVYQHDADEEVKRTHVHGLITGSKFTDQLAYKKRINNRLTLATTDMSWITTFKNNETGAKEKVNENYIIYLHKGMYQPVLVHGFTDTFIKEKHELAYVPPKYLRNQRLDKDGNIVKRSTRNLYDIHKELRLRHQDMLNAGEKPMFDEVFQMVIEYYKEIDQVHEMTEARVKNHIQQIQAFCPYQKLEFRAAVLAAVRKNY